MSKTELKSLKRLQAFATHLLRRHHANSLADLPPGPQEDFLRAAQRAGLDPGFVDKRS